MASNAEYDINYDNYGRQTKVSMWTQAGSISLSQTVYKDTYSSLPSSVTYGNGTVYTYTYDTLDRLVGEYLNSTLIKSYTYDSYNRVLTATDHRTNITENYCYDMAGRVTQIKSSNGSKLIYEYDRYNRTSKISQTYNGTEFNYTYMYGNTANVQKVDLIYGVKLNGSEIITYGYDNLNRKTTRTLGTTAAYTTEYTYYEGYTLGTQSEVVKTVKNGNDTLEYTYDAVGNITQIKKNGTVISVYAYDTINQLISETINGDTYTYTYDIGGNITYVEKNGVTEKGYYYSDTGWKDQLMVYNGQFIDYDSIGNPLNYRDGYVFTWTDGRCLETVTKNSVAVASYTYNADRLRTAKTVNGVTTEYYWQSSVLQAQKTGSEYIIFLYDENGTAYGMLIKDGTTESYYYYVYNAQGDVIGILDSTGTKVVEYTYNAWGELLSTTGTMATTVGEKNPLRYRGYYYDSETGFYSLQSRYYDPEIGRFINADDPSTLVATPMALTDKNLFAYCDNNPVVRVDSSGYIWETILDIGGIGWSTYDLVTNPSWGNLGFLAWDIGATLLPFVPGSYTAKAVKVTAKVASKADDAVDVARVTKKAVVIGEGMDRVKDATKALQRSGVDAKWYQAWGKNFPIQGPNAFDMAKGRNARWLNSKIKKGYDIYDIGLDSRRATRSPFYQLETNILNQKNYPSIPYLWP